VSRHLQFWGVRGSMPVGGAETARYGGHTPCITIDGGGRSVIVLDAGTGIHEFQKTLPIRVQKDGIFTSCSPTFTLTTSSVCRSSGRSSMREIISLFMAIPMAGCR